MPVLLCMNSFIISVRIQRIGSFRASVLMEWIDWLNYWCIIQTQQTAIIFEIEVSSNCCLRSHSLRRTYCHFSLYIFLYSMQHFPYVSVSNMKEISPRHNLNIIIIFIILTPRNNFLAWLLVCVYELRKPVGKISLYMIGSSSVLFLGCGKWIEIYRYFKRIIKANYVHMRCKINDRLFPFENFMTFH